MVLRYGSSDYTDSPKVCPFSYCLSVLLHNEAKNHLKRCLVELDPHCAEVLFFNNSMQKKPQWTPTTWLW